MISLNRITKKFGPTVAVKDVSLEIQRGTVLGMLGPNGAGKTTTVRMIAGLLPPSAGMLTVNGFDPTEENPKVRSLIGYLAEGNPLHDEMPVAAYLRFRSKLVGLSGRDMKQSMSIAIDRCGLEEVISKRCGMLSKGFRQRVGLAASMLHHPSILILDEPTSGLDPQQVTHIRKLINELSHDKTILVISHILSEVQNMCDQIAIFDRGSLLTNGSTQQLKEQGSSIYHVRAVFDSVALPQVLKAIRTSVPNATSQQTILRNDQIQLDIESENAKPGQLERVISGSAGSCLTSLVADLPSLEQVYVRMLSSHRGGS